MGGRRMSTFKKLVEFERFRRAGITTFTRGSALMSIYVEPGITAEGLSEIFGTSKECVRAYALFLVKLGYVEQRVTDIPGRRRVKFYPTMAGIELAEGGE
jgi:DNA-binding MarR family transcriptional regulator